METYKVALSAGDGIGEELVLQSKKILKALEQSFGVSFEIIDILSCGPAIDEYGIALRDEDIEAALGCRAILFGNIGDAQKVNKSQGSHLSMRLPACAELSVCAPTAVRFEFFQRLQVFLP